MAGGGGALGRGGMTTKVRAARLAKRSGAHTVIVGGRIENAISRVVRGENIGTLLYAEEEPMAARKRWLVGQMQSKGAVLVDDGAALVLRKKGTSLLPVGVKTIQGTFSRGDLVVIKTLLGEEIGRGLVNYNSDEAAIIAGQSTQKISVLLGYKDYDELIHRDNLVML